MSPSPSRDRDGAGSHATRQQRATELRRLIETEGEAIGANTRRANRDADEACRQFPDHETARSAARAIKKDAIERLPALIGQLEAAVADNGGQLHRAESAEDATRIVEAILTDAGAESVVKSKSMTAAEAGIETFLTERGYEVTETDLGEYVIQLADEPPAHLVGPAMHKSPDEIAALFNRAFDRTGDRRLSGDPAELTRVAREQIGKQIRTADVGLTGANFIVAETGTLMLVTNEGNARKTAVTPDTHIAVAGVEKLVPQLTDLQPFTELIARAGTGQPISSYVSLLTPPVDTPVPDFDANTFRPADERAFHLVLLDNGRMAMREDETLREALYCIRCGACNNACVPFQVVGGHGFGGETYTGGIGTGWEAGVAGLDSAAAMSSLCTGCTRCEPSCPVGIDIAWLNTVVQRRLRRSGDAGGLASRIGAVRHSTQHSDGVDWRAWLFGHVDTLARLGSISPRLANTVLTAAPTKRLLASVLGIDISRVCPTLAPETLQEWHTARDPAVVAPTREVVLYPDLYTDHFDPARGKAAVRALEALGVRVHVPAVPESGRAPLSQGLIETARSRAGRVHDRLAPAVESGHDIVIIEPSDAAMVRDVYARLLPAAAAERLAEHSYELFEYVYGLTESGAELPSASTVDGTPVAYYSHCQQRTLGVAEYTDAVLSAAGYEVRTVDVECCGMAGSFGYKQEYADVADAAGAHLRETLGTVEGELAASGTSCADQLADLYDRQVPHPIELLDPGTD